MLLVDGRRMARLPCREMSCRLFAINRMLCPRLEVAEFLQMAVDVGLEQVELRNDLVEWGEIDQLGVEQFRRLAERLGVRVVTINAVQKFNAPAHRESAAAESARLVALAGAIGCDAVVLCPNNDPADDRTASEAYSDTVQSLRVLGPIFATGGVTGLVEPLGFPESSLDSLLTAQRAIADSGSNFRLVYDTFHHYLGPDDARAIERDLDISLVGMVHASGVRRDRLKSDLRDEDRGLVDQHDAIGNREQIARLRQLGYAGPVSLEPFAPSLAALSRDELEPMLEREPAAARGGRGSFVARGREVSRCRRTSGIAGAPQRRRNAFRQSLTRSGGHRLVQ